IICSLVAGLAAPLIQSASHKMLDRYFYRMRSDYRHTIRESSAFLTKVHNTDHLTQAVARHIVEAIRVEGVAVYTWHGDSASRSILRASDETRFGAPEIFPAVIAAYFQETAGSALGLHQSSSDRLRSILTTLNWALVLPLLSGETVIGAIAVGPKL